MGIIAQDILDDASQLGNTGLIDNIIDCSNSNSATTPVSHLKACTLNKEHTKAILKEGKQLQCMWCVERKTKLKCLECGKGCCRDDKNFDHVPHWCTQDSKIWDKKEKVEGDNGDTLKKL